MRSSNALLCAGVHHIIVEVHDVFIIMRSSCRYSYYGLLSVNTRPFSGTETDMVKLQ